MKFFTTAILAMASSSAVLASSEQFPKGGKLPAGVPPLPKLTPEQMAKVKKVVNFFYPPCSQKCAIGAMLHSGFDRKAPDPAVICRGGFQGSFAKCAKRKCSAKLSSRILTEMTNMCYTMTPMCAIPCAFPKLANVPAPGAAGAGAAGRFSRVLSEVQVERPSCQPFDLYCSCKDDYAKWYESCLNTSCKNSEDITREIKVGEKLCRVIPPKCAFTCMFKSPTDAGCNPLTDPECGCSDKVKQQLDSCLQKSECKPAEQKQVMRNYHGECKLNKKFLDSLPEIPGDLKQLGLPPIPGFPSNVAQLKDIMGKVGGQVSEALGGLLSPPAPAPGDAPAPGTAAASAGAPAAAPAAPAPVAPAAEAAPAEKPMRVSKSMLNLVRKLSDKPTPTTSD